MSDVGDYEYNTLNTIVGSDIDVPISIDASTVTVPISIDAQTTVLDVSASEVDININTQTVDLDVKQGDSVGATKTIDPTSVTDGTTNFAVGQGVYFPHGCLGHLRKMIVKMKSTDGASASVTFAIAPLPQMEKVYTETFSTSSTSVTDVSTFNPFTSKFWKYDSCVIWIDSIDANCAIAHETIMGKGAYRGLPTDCTLDNDMMRITLLIGAYGKHLPVGGTVNSIKLPNVGAMSKSGAVTINNTTAIILSANGTGTIKTIWWEVSHDLVHLQVFTDGDAASKEISPGNMDTIGHTASTPQYPLTRYTSGGTCDGIIAKQFSFQRQFTIKGREDLGNDETFKVWVEYELLG